MTMTPETAQALGWLAGACRAARVPLGQDICKGRDHLDKARRANPQFENDHAAYAKRIKKWEACREKIAKLEKQIDQSLEEEGF